MKTVVLIKVIILLVMFHTPACAYHKWYDEKEIVHYTQADPPANAKNEDGSSWWGEESDQDAGKAARKKKIEQVRLKMKNSREPKPDIKPAQDIAEDIPPETEAQEPDEESEPDENKGLFKRLFGVFFKGEVEAECKEPWLVEKHGLCAIDKPDMEKVGNTFEALVINNRKGVWSNCRGTYNGDHLKFTFKGDGYWETDGNVPECPFYQGFKWR